MPRHRSATIRYDDETELAPGGAEGDALLLGRYSLGKQIGSGAFGTVWIARDERLARDVAIKALPREHVNHQRFEREARAAARLQHPAIVTLYEAAVDDDGAYLVSELVRGKTFDALLQAGKFSDHDVIEIAIAICQALSHAHEQGVVHRDVKPSNVLVPNRPASGVGRAKLTDFGVAQVIGTDTLTRTGDVIGTPAYMAPEQAQGREVDAAADLYALALMVYEALSGVNPLRERRLGHARRATPFIPPLRRQRRDLPKPLAAAIDRALAVRPQERGTLDEFCLVLRASLEGADRRPGIVAAAGSEISPGTEVLGDAPGAQWREPGGARGHHDSAATEEFERARRRPFGGLRSSGPPTLQNLPEWLPRGLSAGAAGVAAALLAPHLLKTTPLAPSTAGLLVAIAVLALPRLGWLATILTAAGLAADQGRSGAALLLAAVTLVPLVLIWLPGKVLALPAAAPLLALIGLAGAWPALAGQRAFSWYQRAVLGAAGYLWILAASALAQRTLYWWPAHARAGHPPATDAWIGSAHATYQVLFVPFTHAPGIAGAGVWAAGAVVLPLIRSGRWPMVDLVLAGVWSVVIVAALQALGAHPLHGAALGAVAGFVLAGWPALSMIGRDLRDRPVEPAPVL